MKKIFLIVALIFVLSPVLDVHAEIRLGTNTTVVFAETWEARQVLTRRDDFVERMSPFDRAARMKADSAISEKEYLEFVGKNVLAWRPSEKQKIISAFQGMQSRLEALSLSFPDKILMIKTTGNEEGHAAYTRGNAIVLPESYLAASVREIQKTIGHELFHIVSRANPELREKLYASIGFIPTSEPEFPSALKARKITNPDAPRNDHYIRLQYHGNDIRAIPILFSSAEKYDKTRGGEFFDYLQFQFLLVNAGRDHELVRVRDVSGFVEQVGRNTGYIIHPEEILADNFALLILGQRDVPSPEILAKISRALKNSRAPESAAASDRWTRVEGGSWLPSDEIMQQINAHIEPYMKSQESVFGRPLRKWNTYHFQYQGQDEQGRKFVYINAFCDFEKDRNLNKEFVSVLDGGSCFFQLKYDPVSDRFFQTFINGEA